MSVIHVNKVASKIKPMFEQFLDVSDLTSHKPKDREALILSRCLAAYGVFCFAGSSEDEAASSVVDGGNDNGIDAIYYSAQTRRLIIVQAKWQKEGKGEPENAAVKKFRDGVADLVRLNFDKFNLKVQNKREVISNALERYDTKIELVLIYTGKADLSEHNQIAIQDMLSDLNDIGDGEDVDNIVSFHRLNLGDIYSRLATGLEGDPIELEVGFSPWGKSEEPNLTIFGLVAGDDIADWWINYDKRIFAKNIRQMLGDTDVNNEMRFTLRNEPHSFYYYNNGITVIADSIKKSAMGGNSKEIGSFKLVNASVVNGAQTVGVLGRHKKEGGSLDGVRLLVRIISIGNAGGDFGSNITKSNNRQNKIDNRDFVSLDVEQLRLRKELLMDNMDYIIVRAEGQIGKKISSIDLVEATVALACASRNISWVVQSKREVGKFFEDLSKSLYRGLFNANVSGVYVKNTVLSLREVEQEIALKINALTKKSGKRYGVLVHGNRMISYLVFNKIHLSEDAKLDTFSVSNYSWGGLVETYVVKLIDIIESKYQDKFLATLFKNATICKSIADEIKTEESGR